MLPLDGMKCFLAELEPSPKRQKIMAGNKYFLLPLRATFCADRY